MIHTTDDVARILGTSREVLLLSGAIHRLSPDEGWVVSFQRIGMSDMWEMSVESYLCH